MICPHKKLFETSLHIVKNKKLMLGKDAFLLYQSYGFPIEMINELSKEKNFEVDLEDNFDIDKEIIKEEKKKENKKIKKKVKKYIKLKKSKKDNDDLINLL